MLQGFFTLYYLVKNVPPSKVFFRFCKEPDLFCIYPKTAQNALFRSAAPSQNCLNLLHDPSPLEYGLDCGDFYPCE